MEGCVSLVGVGARGTTLVLKELSSTGDVLVATSELWGAIALDFEVGCSTDLGLARIVVLDLGGGFSIELACWSSSVGRGLSG